MFAPPVSALASGMGPPPVSRGTVALTPLDGMRPMPSEGSFSGGSFTGMPGARGRTASANQRPSPLATTGRATTAALNATMQTNLNDADNIKVAVRVRPLFPHETDKGGTTVVQVNSNTTIKVVVPGPAGTSMQRDFAFHACLGPEVGQADVMQLCGVPQLLDAALGGYNVTIFAYGQTGSGKTYTMSGREEVIAGDGYTGADTHDGIISRAVQHLFAAMAKKTDTKYALSASYLEIYNEGIYDLLNLKAKNLPVKWDATLGFFVPGLKQVTCSKVDTMAEVIRTGMRHRHVGSHELNIESSRSHSIMTIFVQSTPSDPGAADFGTPRIGKISFVDLAGSERLKDSKSEGAMLKETTNINKSLFVLGKVISALAERESSGTTAHIPYRDSKLTKLLMDSLGGNALALMIACCSPASTAVEETLSTLSYATRAKNIQNRPTVQYDPKEAQIANLRREIDLLRQENTYLREQLRTGGGPRGGSAGTHSGSFGGLLTDSFHASYDTTDPGTPTTNPSLIHTNSHLAAVLSAAPHLPPARLGSPRLATAAGGDLRASLNAGSGGGGHHLEPLRMSLESAGLGAGSPGLLGNLRKSGQASASAAASPDVAGDRGPDDLMKRLMETQTLLTRFSEENGRLAKENDRLRAGRQMLSQEHGEVLDEIETLRSKLVQLESAVLSGTQTPNAAKAALHSALGTRSDSPLGRGLSTSSSSISGHLRNSSFTSGGGAPGLGLASPLSSFGPMSTSHSVVSTPKHPTQLNPHPLTHAPQQWPPLMAHTPLPGMPHPPLPTPPGSSGPPRTAQYGGAEMPYGAAPGSAMGMGGGMVMMGPPGSGGGGMMMGPPGSGGGGGGYGATQPQPPPSGGAGGAYMNPHAVGVGGGGHGGVANVMAVGGGAAAGARTRTKYGNGGAPGSSGGGGGGDDSIIVADKGKLALLLGDGPVEPAVPLRPVPIKPSQPTYANPAKAHHEQLIQKQLNRGSGGGGGGSNPSSPQGGPPGAPPFAA